MSKCRLTNIRLDIGSKYENPCITIPKKYLTRPRPDIVLSDIYTHCTMADVGAGDCISGVE